MRKLSKVLHAVMMLAVGVALASCGNYSQRVFHAQPTEFEKIRTMAILPLENLSKDNKAEEVVDRSLRKAAQGLEQFKIISPEEARVKTAKAKLSLRSKNDRKKLLKIGQVLGVDALLVGSVLEYAYLREVKNGTVVSREPAFGLHLRLVETKKGKVLWASVHSRSSYDLLRTNSDNISNVVDATVEKMLKDLLKGKRKK